jgi:Peroxidase, family 2
MKLYTSLLTVGLVARSALAFPTIVTQPLIKEGAQNERRQFKGATPPFDAQAQYVSTSGAHAFRAPSGSDQRGPCPGLNAMANHGYLPHSGVGTQQDFLDGCQEAFGMGADLAGFLAVYGAIFDGDLTSYSIGGPYPGLIIGNLLGTPQGLSGSHNKYEGDVSPTRGDLYQYGESYEVQMSQFKDLYELGQQNGDSIDLDVLTGYRYTRFQESVNQNPYFFNAPFSGVIASPAAWSFIYRFMANKSAENPEGVLNGEVFKSFNAITGDYPNFVYTPGHEKFPENWYKRNPIDVCLHCLQCLHLSQTLMFPVLYYPLSLGGYHRNGASAS